MAVSGLIGGHVSCQRGNNNIVILAVRQRSDADEEMILRLNYSMFIPILVLLYASVWSSLAVEFTFELPDRDQQCFHEEIKQGTKGTLEYQVTY